MNHYILLIAGVPATGKTTFAKIASERLAIPCLCKDEVKEFLWNGEINSPEEIRSNGAKAYNISFYFAEQLMKAGVSFVFESNFRKAGEEILGFLSRKYDFKVVTVHFDAEINVLHKRFLERDNTSQRHQSLKSGGYYNDIKFFEENSIEDRAFFVGEKISVDTTDFHAVNYDEIINKINCLLSFEDGIERDKEAY